MKDEQFDDLKQFIETTVGQSEARLKEELASKNDLRTIEKKLSDKMDAGFAGVGVAFEAHDKEIEEQLADHGTRITTLEQTA